MNNDQERGLSRRAFVGKVTVGAAGGALAISVARSASAVATGSREGGSSSIELGASAQPDLSETREPVENPVGTATLTESAPAPWNLLEPLNAGSSLTDDWSVASLSGVVRGACVLTLVNERGRTQRVHICQNAGSPQGLVYTDRFDMVVMNGGRGDLPTEESFGQAVAAVAHAIAGNEGRGTRIDGLLSQTEREERFASAAHLR